ncbi:BatA domain-containing protein [Hymenobacter lucidus]|uniref:BatA domain-containing protein n=1 Tax=Hymenobacter lucidus TaxID=2880930 RepID=A0ABS8AUL2_9BACT|nr:BatA domain-containing protein [Hymenobacter lucidus]MCB2409263.1 BatA domain-containing protein [Hymenobacter lucidus]
MLTFLAPSSGLLALLGLVVPVAIHLWNRRPARTVPVGSIRWLAVAANRRMRNLKLEQWLVLLLRAGLVALLAGAVGGPVWRQPPPPRLGQVFISPDLLASESVEAVRATIDSLRRRGFALRQLSRNFPRISDTTWQQLRTAPRPPATATYDFWSRVQQAADSFPGQPIRVYTSATLRHFRGNRPALPTTVSWQALPLPGARTTWLTGASLSAPDSLRLLFSQSTTEAVLTSRRTVARPQQNGLLLPRIAGLPPLRYQSEAGGQAFIQVLDTDSNRVPVQTQPLRVWVYHDAGHALDARYMRAALRAAALGLAPRLELAVASTPPALTKELDWLYWLADTPVPAAWQQRTARGLMLWQDGRQPGTSVATTFAVTPQEEQYRISRLDTTLSHNSATVVWLAATGQPVLTHQQAGRGGFYRFHSRLHPAWSSLADSPDLPLLLLPLLQPDSTHTFSPHDQRQLAPAQILAPQPPSSAPQPAWPARASAIDMRPWLLLAAALLWLLERWVAGRTAAKPRAV